MSRVNNNSSEWFVLFPGTRQVLGLNEKVQINSIPHPKIQSRFQRMFLNFNGL